MVELDNGGTSNMGEGGEEEKNDILGKALEGAKVTAEKKDVLEKTREHAEELEKLADEFASYGLYLKVNRPTKQDLEKGLAGRLHVFVGESTKNPGGFHTYESLPDRSGGVQVRTSEGVHRISKETVISNDFKEAKRLTMQEAAKNDKLGIAEDTFSAGSNLLKDKYRDMI